MFLHDAMVARPWKSSWYMLLAGFHLGSLFLSETRSPTLAGFLWRSASPSCFSCAGRTMTALPSASTRGTITSIALGFGFGFGLALGLGLG